MKPVNARLLTINGGSSSIKFAFYDAVEPLKRGLHGTLDRIGLSGTNLMFHDADGKPQAAQQIAATDDRSAANSLVAWTRWFLPAESAKMRRSSGLVFAKALAFSALKWTNRAIPSLRQ